jgi:hypothetical protein
MLSSKLINSAIITAKPIEKYFNFFISDAKILKRIETCVEFHFEEIYGSIYSDSS